MMDKVWFLQVDGKKEGPYSLRELKWHPKVTPDTLAWKEGFKAWLPIRQIPELKPLFEDDVLENQENPAGQKGSAASSGEDSAMALRYEPPSFYFLILLAALMAFYVLYQLIFH